MKIFLGVKTHSGVHHKRSGRVLLLGADRRAWRSLDCSRTYSTFRTFEDLPSPEPCSCAVSLVSLHTTLLIDREALSAPPADWSGPIGTHATLVLSLFGSLTRDRPNSDHHIPVSRGVNDATRGTVQITTCARVVSFSSVRGELSQILSVIVARKALLICP